MKDYIPPKIDAILCIIALASALACFVMAVHHQNKIEMQESEKNDVPQCCYIPGKGVQVCAEPGVLLAPNEQTWGKGK